MVKKVPAPRHQPVKESWKNRIIGTGEETPENLLANPKNFRIHPKAQQDGLAAILDRVGWVQNVVVNQRTGFLVDGHLRVTLAMRRNEPRIPVAYVDLSQEEEDIILATLDPLTGLATIDKGLLEELLKGLDPEETELQALLAILEADLGIGEEKDRDVETILAQAVQVEPGKELVVIMCNSDEEFAEIRNLFGLELVRRGGYRKGSAFDSTGIERVVKAEKVISIMRERR